MFGFFYLKLDPIKADIEVYQDQKLTGEGEVTYFLLFKVSGLREQKTVEGITYSQSNDGLSTVLPFIGNGNKEYIVVEEND